MNIRKSLWFYSVKLLAYELMVCAIGIFALIISLPFKKTLSYFDVLAWWAWIYYWKKDTWTWSFLGYVIGVLIASVIVEQIANKLWNTD